MNVSTAINGFILHKASEGKSPRTLSEYERQLTLLCDHLNDPETARITTTDLRAFLAYLRTNYRPRRFNGKTHPLSAKTLRNVWITLRSFYTWATAELDVDDALKGIKAPAYELPAIDPLTEAAIQTLLKYCKRPRQVVAKDGRRFSMKRPTATRDLALILFLLDTGLRSGECARLTTGDVDLADGDVIVKPHNASRKSKPRHVFLGKASRSALWRYLATRDVDGDPDAPLFATLSGTALSADTLRHHVSRLGQRAGISSPVYPHRFRHTFALMFLRNGGNVYALQRLLGHSDLAMCRRYLALVQADCQSAHRRASPVDRWHL